MVDFAAARKKMVENQLRTSNITDHRLLMAMAQVPRELFVPSDRQAFAYIDEAHRLSAGDTPTYLSAPAPFGQLLQLAAIGTNDRVLDLGCGSGYSAAVLGSLAASVVAVEPVADLAASAANNVMSLGFDNVSVLSGALADGAPSRGPFDVIVVEGAVSEVPAGLFDQLAEGGRLVALRREGAAGVAYLYVRSGTDVAGRPEFNTTLPPLAAPKPLPEFVF